MKHGITFPLLSDEGSAAIKSLGLLNEQANEAVFGIPHPGTFVLNADGTVRSKRFYPSYRERDNAQGVLVDILGIETRPLGAQEAAVAGGVGVKAAFDSPIYAWGQRVWLTVELDIPEGLHVYGEPIPEGYYPLSVEVEPIDRVVVGPSRFPTTTPFRVQGLAEDFEVFTGRTRVRVPVTFMLVDGGTLDIAVKVSFQACSDTECLMPESLRFVLPMAEEPLIERPTPRA